MNRVAESFSRLIFLGILALTIATYGCTTTEERDHASFEEAPLFGMVYDYNGQPCAGAIISIDAETQIITDINGRFVVQSLSKGNHNVNVSKQDFETLSVSFEFLSRNQALYLKIISFDQLIAKIERVLEERKLGEAASLIERADRIRKNDPILSFLQAIYYKQAEEYLKAIDVLINLIRRGNVNCTVYLFLADIYEYYLDDDSNAIKHLNSYLKLCKSTDAQERLKTLEARMNAQAQAEEENNKNEDQKSGAVESE